MRAVASRQGRLKQCSQAGRSCDVCCCLAAGRLKQCSQAGRSCGACCCLAAGAAEAVQPSWVAAVMRAVASRQGRLKQCSRAGSQ
eukprot:325350-Chlamydomonas_euryale.AAC.2